MKSKSHHFNIETIIPYSRSFLKFYNPKYAYAYYKNCRINLLNSRIEPYSICKLHEKLLNISFEKSFLKPKVIHLFYEFGYFYHDQELLISDDQLLAIDIEYEKVSEFKLLKRDKLKVTKLSSVVFQDYKYAFEDGHYQLKRGNCYQFNLTFPYKFMLDGLLSIDNIASVVWNKSSKIGAYGHITSVPFLKKIFISNSPECLFQIKRKYKSLSLYSMPIKGSIAIYGNKSIGKLWNKLSTCSKNRAELNIITDLVRNDLAKIEKPISKVLKMCQPIVVPGILHQYSLVNVELSFDVKLGNILTAIFPGGSITGSPKKNVIKILNSLEGRARGLYCGSTIILYKNIMAASLNIRTGTLSTDDNNLEAFSGGGITLLSDINEEFNEMNLKMDSFISIFM